MELWFSDYHTDKVKMSVKVEKQLFGEQTDFQRIDVFDSKEWISSCLRYVGPKGRFVMINRADRLPPFSALWNR